MHDSPAIRFFLSVIAIAALIVAIRRRTLAAWLPALSFSSLAAHLWFQQPVFIGTGLATSFLWVLQVTFRPALK